MKCFPSVTQTNQGWVGTGKQKNNDWRELVPYISLVSSLSVVTAKKYF